jgi:hypothetical protein
MKTDIRIVIVHFANLIPAKRNVLKLDFKGLERISVCIFAILDTGKILCCSRFHFSPPYHI